MTTKKKIIRLIAHLPAIQSSERLHNHVDNICKAMPGALEPIRKDGMRVEECAELIDGSKTSDIHRVLHGQQYLRRHVLSLLVTLALGVSLGYEINQLYRESSSPNIEETEPVIVIDGSLAEVNDTQMESKTYGSLHPVPPLSSLVSGNEIVGDVGWMVDFSIVDFPKCGTTFLMNYLRRHAGNETYIHQGEICDMDKQNPARIVKRYYEPHLNQQWTKDGRRVKFGFKCPKDLETEHALQLYSTHFPETKFIVSVRHPVLW